MAFIRAYQMQARTAYGRGQLKGDPFIGALVTRVGGLVAPGLGKLAKKGLSKVLGKGKAQAVVAQAPASIKKAARAAGGFGGAVGAGIVAERLTRGRSNGFRRYRRINAGNAKALKRAFRRIEQFGKLARKAGYVRRQPSCRTRSRKR